MKTRALIWIVCMMLMIAGCCSAEELSIFCEYDDGSRVAIENGCTIESDGELGIALEGLDAAQVYRIQLKGNAIDGTAFVDHRGSAAESSAVCYFTLTDKAGTYGSFELVIAGGETTETITFSVNVQPDKNKDWLEYGILNDAGYAEMPVFLPIVKGEITAEMDAEDFAILEPVHGSVLSGDKNCILELLFDMKVANKTVEWKVCDMETNEKIAGMTEKLPFVSSLYACVDADKLEYGRQYVLELVAGNQRAHSTFSLVEEKGGLTQGAEETAAARQELTEKWIEEDMAREHGNEQSENKIDDIMQKLKESYGFKPIQPDEKVETDKVLYNRLVDAFNAEYESYHVGMTMMDGVFAYKDDVDEGGILQTYAYSWDWATMQNLEPTMESADWHKAYGLQCGNSIVAVNKGSDKVLPINEPRNVMLREEYNSDPVVATIAYMPIMTTDDECAADILIIRELIRGQVFDGHWFLFVRFMDPQRDKSIVYEWNIANQTLAKEILGYLDENRMVWAAGRNAENWDTGEDVKVEEQIQKVRIRKSGDVNVRRKSTSESERIGSAKAGAEYPCLDVEENGWFKIQLENGDTGFISGKMAELIE